MARFSATNWGVQVVYSLTQVSFTLDSAEGTDPPNKHVHIRSRPTRTIKHTCSTIHVDRLFPPQRPRATAGLYPVLAVAVVSATNRLLPHLRPEARDFFFPPATPCVYRWASRSSRSISPRSRMGISLHGRCRASGDQKQVFVSIREDRFSFSMIRRVRCPLRYCARGARMV